MTEQCAWLARCRLTASWTDRASGWCCGRKAARTTARAVDNPQTHDPAGRTLYAVHELIAQIGAEPLQSGLTLSGGEPFEQSAALMPIARAARARGLSRPGRIPAIPLNS